MSNCDWLKAKCKRRDVIKAGGYGICVFCLASVGGCALIRNEKIEKQDLLSEEPLPEVLEKGLIKTEISPWFEKMDDGALTCTLCPKSCKLNNGERGRCRVRKNIDGQGYSLVFGNPALVQEDPVERKPFYHVFPGSRALSVSTAGCNLACKFCEVWDMALVDPEEVHSYDMPPQKVIEYALAADLPAVSFAFGEPVVFYEYMQAVAQRAKSAGLLNLMHTAGYINPAPLKKILRLIDAVNFDLKGFDEEFYREYVGGELDIALQSLKTIGNTDTHLEITMIIIPTINDDPTVIRQMCRWIAAELGPETPLHFARFYPLYKLSGLPRTPVSALETARNVALEEGLKHVYIAKVTGHDGENTFCPQCSELLISRTGFVIDEMTLDQGRCLSCETVLGGLWTKAN